ncbi:MAG: glycoside hydrolase family 127 protein [Clostridia bacterium]|nr:glycoside hydrolase family 127 protein [Clostridia bacterium]
MVNYIYQYPAPGALKLEGKPEEFARFVEEKQLLKRDVWAHFVEVFRIDADIQDNGWRGEYWGKMMRGACLTYRYTKNPALYDVLTEAVRGLLDAQKSDGRIVTYDEEHEYHGWDMWSRKYVLTGLQHYYDICTDEAFKSEIARAMVRHADAILAKVGPGKIDITTTSNFWAGVNSCSILEPMVRLYSITKEARFLDFAAYILSTGGCGAGNLIELAIENVKMPYEYPEVKAYETMSFFEGVLAYYEVTGEEKYLDAVSKFVEAVAKTDITVIGSAGCTHELFDHSAARQTEYSETIMQETCVTVTWMRLLSRLLLLTGDLKYAGRIETAALNALYGAINTEGLEQYSFERKKYVAALPFDSYSPLYNNRRGRGIGGYKEFADGSYYGCCACIAAAGVALFPLDSVLSGKDGFLFTAYLSGSASLTTPSGNPLTLVMKADNPVPEKWTLALSLDEAEEFSLSFRLPGWSAETALFVNGEKVTSSVITRKWQSGDEVTLAFRPYIREVRLNGRTALLYGPYVLARDQAKEAPGADLAETISLAREKGALKATFLPAEGLESLRLVFEKADGTPQLMTDYASCGKNWLSENASITAWHNVI